MAPESPPLPRLRRRPVPEGSPLPGLHPVLDRVYRARGVTAAELDLSLAGLASRHDLGGLEEAAALVADTVAAGGRILVVADFDADGATGCALLLRALGDMGAQAPDYLVPDRQRHGYGLSPAVVELAAARRPDLLITVDNGITSLAGVEAARAAGMAVVVTDHHLPGPALPAADAIVDPNLPGDPFPSKHLAGVGVAFYLAAAVRARLDACGWFGRARPRPRLDRYLDLVALGTVADVVPLDRNNRILVHQGLGRLRSGQGCAGIRALLEAGRRDPGRAVAADLGFCVGPRLNAAGRLEDMGLGIRCLLEDDPGRARRLAAELDELNARRREIEAGMRAEAEALVEGLDPGSGGLPAGVCLFEPDWHQGVVGIVAGRMKDRLHRPVVAFARDRGGMLKGSARSVRGCHIRDAVAAVDRDHPGLIRRFGGHAMAAGLVLAEGGLETFSARIARAVEARLGPVPPEPEIWTDGLLEEAHLDLATAETLRGAGPWGQAFPEPLFEGRFRVRHRRVVGETHLRLRLETAGGREVDAIFFGGAPLADACAGGEVELVYRLDVNEYRGRCLQLVVEGLAPPGWLDA